jgi:hypothetical protein
MRRRIFVTQPRSADRDVAWALARYLTTPAAKEVFAAAGAE